MGLSLTELSKEWSLRDTVPWPVTSVVFWKMRGLKISLTLKKGCLRANFVKKMAGKNGSKPLRWGLWVLDDKKWGLRVNNLENGGLQKSPNEKKGGLWARAYPYYWCTLVKPNTLNIIHKNCPCKKQFTVEMFNGTLTQLFTYVL